MYTLLILEGSGSQPFLLQLGGAPEDRVFATCDVTGKDLTLGDWYHKRGEDFDICGEEFRRRPDEERAGYIAVTTLEALGDERSTYAQGWCVGRFEEWVADSQLTLVDMFELHERVHANAEQRGQAGKPWQSMATMATCVLRHGLYGEDIAIELCATVTEHMRGLPAAALVERVCHLLRQQFPDVSHSHYSLNRNAFWESHRTLYENGTEEVVRLMDSLRPSDEEFRQWCLYEMEERYLHYTFHSARDPWVRHLGSSFGGRTWPTKAPVGGVVVGALNRSGQLARRFIIIYVPQPQNTICGATTMGPGNHGLHTGQPTPDRHGRVH